LKREGWIGRRKIGCKEKDGLKEERGGGNTSKLVSYSK